MATPPSYPPLLVSAYDGISYAHDLVSRLLLPPLLLLLLPVLGDNSTPADAAYEGEEQGEESPALTSPAHLCTTALTALLCGTAVFLTALTLRRLLLRILLSYNSWIC